MNRPEKGKYRLFTQAQADFIRYGYQVHTIEVLTERLNEKFDTAFTVAQVRAFTRNHALKSGRTGRFVKGGTPFNKGVKGWQAGGRSAETRFKKGCSTVSIGGQSLNTKGFQANRCLSIFAGILKDATLKTRVLLHSLRHILQRQSGRGIVMKECTTHHHACDCREAAYAEEVAKLKGQIYEMKYALINISNALDAYGVSWCRSISLDALDKLKESGNEN